MQERLSENQLKFMYGRHLVSCKLLQTSDWTVACLKKYAYTHIPLENIIARHDRKYNHQSLKNLSWDKRQRKDVTINLLSHNTAVHREDNFFFY